MYPHTLCSTSQNLWLCSLKCQRDFTNIIKLKILRWEVISMKYRSPYREKEGSRRWTKARVMKREAGSYEEGGLLALRTEAGATGQRQQAASGGWNRKPVPVSLQRECRSADTDVGIPDLPRRGIVSVCCLKARSLWSFVATAKGNTDAKFKDRQKVRRRQRLWRVSRSLPRPDAEILSEVAFLWQNHGTNCSFIRKGSAWARRARGSEFGEHGSLGRSLTAAPTNHRHLPGEHVHRFPQFLKVSPGPKIFKNC